MWNVIICTFNHLIDYNKQINSGNDMAFILIQRTTLCLEQKRNHKMISIIYLIQRIRNKNMYAQILELRQWLIFQKHERLKLRHSEEWVVIHIFPSNNSKYRNLWISLFPLNPRSPLLSLPCFPASMLSRFHQYCHRLVNRLSYWNIDLVMLSSLFLPFLLSIRQI